jgi:acyl carrier protein
MPSIEQRIIKIVSSVMGDSETEITASTNFESDLKADSLDTVEMLMALEDEFEIDIADEDAEKLVTVQLAVEFFEKRVKPN